YQRMRYNDTIIMNIYDYVTQNTEERRVFLREGIEESQVSLTRLGNWGSSDSMLTSTLPFADSVVVKLRELVAIAYGLDTENELHMRLIEKLVK
ncbi:hypothetical protein ACFLY9_02950, partial [Patescibacteria group bacterium]